MDISLDIYNESTRKRLMKIVDFYLNKKARISFFKFIDKEFCNILNNLTDFIESTKYEIEWFKINICFHLLCIRHTLLEKYLLKDPINNTDIPITKFETNYDINKTYNYCKNENYLYEMFNIENENFKFLDRFIKCFALKQFEIKEVYEFMIAYLDLKMCSNIILLHLASYT